MSKPSISIIVPVYNVEPYLRRCLDSLVSQTLRDIEIICVDDGSTDACPAILREYAARDTRVRIITQRNAGLSAARNAGMRVASAEYIAFVDSDDYVEPHTYELAINHIEPGVDYVCFGAQVEGQASEEELHAYKLYLQHSQDGRVELTDKFMLSCDVIAWNKLFRRSIICEHEIDFPVGLRYEDNYFFRAYCAWARRATYIPEKLYHYVRHAGAIMSKTLSGKEGYAIDFLEVAIRLHRYYEQHKLLPEKGRYIGRVFFQLLNKAIELEYNAEKRHEIVRRADTFLSHAGSDLADAAELRYRRMLMERGILPGTVRKHFYGLFSTKYKAHCAKHYFMGIPLFTNHHLLA